MQAVNRRNREVTTFNTRAVTNVVAIEIFAGNPGSFFRVDVVHRTLHVYVPLHGVKHEELRLRAEQGAVGDAGGLEIFLGTACNGARVTLVALHGRRLYDVAGDVHGGFFSERIEYGSLVVRHQDHVGFVDAFPARDGGAVKHLAVGEKVLIHFGGRQCNVLLFTATVSEAQVDPFDFVFFDQINCLGHCACSVSYTAQAAVFMFVAPDRPG